MKRYTSVWENATLTDAAVSRIAGQLAFDEPVNLLGLLGCENGRKTEQRLHARFKAQRVKCLGREWFATNRHEVWAAMEECAERV